MADRQSYLSHQRLDGASDMIAHPPRIARTIPRGKRRPNPRRDVQHLAFIRTLPCIACVNPAPSECAHIRTGTDGGAGFKPSDRYTVPLCAWCHRLAQRSQHNIGELAFWSALKIDPLNVALRLWTVSGDLVAGERAVDRARQGIGLAAGRP